MLKPFSKIAFLLLFSTMVVPPARADTPRAGSNEFRLEGSYLIPGVHVTGLTRQSRSSGGMSSESTTFGAGFAYGRFLTDNLEIGSAVSVLRVGGSGGSSQWSYGASPFARAFTLVTDRIAVYGGPVCGIQYVTGSSGSDSTGLSLGADAGVEYFVGDAWSLRVGPGYRYIRQTVDTSAGSGTTTGNVYGVNWALAGYF